MIWNDEGIIISKKKYGESSLILKIFTKEHGVFSGFVKGASKKTKSNISKYEVGNIVECEWKSRIEDGLGSFKIEVKESLLGYFIIDKKRLTIFNLLTSFINSILQEREGHLVIYDNFLNIFKEAKNINTKEDLEQFLISYISLQLLALHELGYQLDLTECAVTKTQNNLKYISPKTGRAVCEEIGKPYKDKIFALPVLLKQLYNNEELNIINLTELQSSFQITNHFIVNWLMHDKFHEENFKKSSKEILHIIQ